MLSCTVVKLILSQSLWPLGLAMLTSQNDVKISSNANRCKLRTRSLSTRATQTLFNDATTLAPLRILVVQGLVFFFASERMSGSFGVAFGHLTMLWFAWLSIGTWEARGV